MKKKKLAPLTLDALDLFESSLINFELSEIELEAMKELVRYARLGLTLNRQAPCTTPTHETSTFN